MSGGPALDVGGLVRRLGLAPHPEGGFCRETFRSPLMLHLSDGQAAEPVDQPVLCGCTVAPGFDFADFEMGDGEALVRPYPAEAELIRRLAR